MVETGVLDDSERVELIEGELLVLNPQGPIHAGLTQELRDVLLVAYGRGYFARDHSPVVGTPFTIPEPDIAVVRGEPRALRGRHPGPADVVLVVEISSSSRRADRRKADVYAQAGFGHYWIVDVERKRTEVRTAPKQGVYLSVEMINFDVALALPERPRTITITIAELLSPT